MRTTITFLLAAMIPCGGLNAQQLADGRPMYHDTRSGEDLAQASPVRTEVVNERFAICPWHANALRRDVYRMTDGTFQVRVISASGTLRHQGTYLDEALAVPHGEASYYHPSGQLESSGRYMNGIKAGVWERGSWDGHRLAERVYPGLAWDDLEIFVGVAVRARTLGDRE